MKTSSVHLSESVRNVFLGVLAMVIIAGCSGTRTFHEYARAGDTVAIGAGWKENFSRDRISVYITPSDSSPDIVLGPDDPAIRAVVNFYPDPLSSLVVSDRTNQDLTPFAQLYGSNVNNNFTDGETNWFQTVVFVDLPPSLPPGLTKIYIDDPSGDFAQSTLEIVSGVGSPNSFSAESSGALTRNHLAVMERTSYYKVSFSGPVVPHAIQLDLAHGPDKDSGGVGKAYAVNPISGVKSVTWTDDGTSMRVILLPAASSSLSSFNDFVFYIAGGIQGLLPGTITAFDIDGNEIAGVVASVEANDINVATAN